MARNAAGAFNATVLLMVGMVLSIAGGLTFKIARAVRRADAIEG